MVEKIKFIIDDSGEVQLSVEGAVGKSCEALTEPFEKMLGITSKRTYKDSYYADHLQTSSEAVEGGES